MKVVTEETFECDFCCGTYNVAEKKELPVRRDTIVLMVCPFCSERSIDDELAWRAR